MVLEITKIYWVTHPAFSVASKNLTPAAAKHFIESKLRPLVALAQSDPSSLLVLVKTNKDIPAFKKPGYSESRIRKLLAIERAFERFALASLGQRAIVSVKAVQDKAAEEVKRLITERGFSVSRHAQITGHGSYRTMCAYVFPEVFREKAGVSRRITVSADSTLAFRSRRTKKSGNMQLNRKRLP